MKKGLLTLVVILTSALNLYSAEITIKGIYQGQNLFVNNPFAPSGVGFCVFEVTVNGMTTTDEIASSAFEINLGVYNFKLGDDVSIDIKYKDGCKPMIINPEVVYPKASFQLINLDITNDKLVWSTANELGKLPFIVEQYKWNKWIKVGIINGKGGKGPNSYTAPIRLNSGANRFRIKQTDVQGNKKLSKEIERNNPIKAITFTPEKVDDEIVFSGETMYEIYDEFGSIVFKGFSTKINCANLKKGKYYLNYDNTMGEFVKK